MKKIMLFLIVTPITILAMESKQNALELWKDSVDNRAMCTSSDDVLYNFVRQGNVDIVEAALSNNMSVDTYSNGITMLAEACICRHFPIITLLLSRGADVNLIGCYNNTPLDEVVSMLSDHQHIMQETLRGQQQIKEYETILETLLLHGAKPTISVKVPVVYMGYTGGRTHLTTAIEKAAKLPNVLALFKKHGYDQNSPKIVVIN